MPGFLHLHQLWRSLGGPSQLQQRGAQLVHPLASQGGDAQGPRERSRCGACAQAG
jgi:hypothetical protein